MSLLKSLIVVGDRVLIEADPAEKQTHSGLYLPANVQEKVEVRTGRIIKVGPGYPIPATQDPDDFFRADKEPVQYVPLQAQEGDCALFLRKGAIEIEYDGAKYLICPQSNILLIIRDALAELNI
jgi:chaperonin GroES